MPITPRRTDTLVRGFFFFIFFFLYLVCTDPIIPEKEKKGKAKSTGGKREIDLRRQKAKGKIG